MLAFVITFGGAIYKSEGLELVNPRDRNGLTDYLIRIPTVKLKIPVKNHGKIRIPNFCYIQVIVFDLSYLLVAAVGF